MIHRVLAAIFLASAAGAQLPLLPIPPGKTALVILAHHDDHTWQYGLGGTIAKMSDAAYTVYFVRVTNDEKDGGAGWGNNDQTNLREAIAATRFLGVKEVLSLNWRNDHMDSIPLNELRAQLILLIRKHRPEVVISWNPWGHYDRNPDHRKVARAAGEAVWMAGLANIHPEHLETGLAPHRVPHLFYTQRNDYGKGHDPNAAIELDDGQVQRKAGAYWAHANVRYNPAAARALRRQLDAQGLTIPELDGLTDEQANEKLEKWHMIWISAQRGKENGVKYAEVCRYLDEWRDVPGLRDYILGSAEKK
ncbi:MAG: PIG-L family deacetylase [Acidobacteria bacterium]|nr:PIG-L family deacetylase [Acidobacteriota bacterium]